MTIAPAAADLAAPVGARPLRVAVLSRVFKTAGGGAETYSVRLVEALAGRCEIHVFAQEIGEDRPGVTCHPVRLALRKPRWVNQLGYAWATWRATREGFDVVHSHENTWHGQIQTLHVRPVRASLLSGRSGLKLAWQWLRIALSPRLITYLALERARCAPAPGRAIVATSEALGRELLEAYPECGPQLHTVTPGVRMPRAGVDRMPARQALGLPADGPLLLLVANDYRRKGLDALLQALALLPPGVSLAVAGRGDQLAAYRAAAESLGVARRAHFLGACADMDAVYASADLLVHPTLEDSYAMAVLEAMSHGLPVVVSGPAWCGISALLVDGADALLVSDPRDAGLLARQVRRVLDDPALSQRLGEAGRRFAAGHGWDRVADAYMALYRQAALRP